MKVFKIIILISLAFGCNNLNLKGSIPILDNKDTLYVYEYTREFKTYNIISPDFGKNKEELNSFIQARVKWRDGWSICLIENNDTLYMYHSFLAGHTSKWNEDSKIILVDNFGQTYSEIEKTMKIIDSNDYR
ncbi:hypothetical protein [Algivirga pacifica]|uniref:Lipoprotein n=1 Tax=Algivirga pacifica TaxID=1162670 RepID=A0ABP9D2H1_9BACT